MDDSEIARKIQALKLELEKKQRKLKKWTNKKNKTHAASRQQLQLNCNDQTNNGNSLERSADLTSSKQSAEALLEKEHFPSMNKDTVNDCPVEDNFVHKSELVLEHRESFTVLKEASEPAISASPPALSYYDESVKKSNMCEDDEDLFPDIETVVEDEQRRREIIINEEEIVLRSSDHCPENNLKLNRLQNTSTHPEPMPEQIHKTGEDHKEDVKTDCTVSGQDVDSSKSTSGLDSEDSSKSLKRRSTRLASRSCPTFKAKRNKYDENSVIVVAFEVLVQLARAGKIYDFELPDIDFEFLKQEKVIEKRVLEEHCESDSKTRTCNTEKPSSNAMHTSQNLDKVSLESGLQLSNLQEGLQPQISQTGGSLLNSKTEVETKLGREYQCTKDILGKSNKIIPDFKGDHSTNVTPTDKVNVKSVDNEENEVIECEHSSQNKTSLGPSSFTDSENTLCLNSKHVANCVLAANKTDDVVEERGISEVCESVLKTVIDILLIDLSERKLIQEIDDHDTKEIEVASQESLQQPSEALVFHAKHSLQCGAEPVEGLFLLCSEGTEFLIVHQRSCFVGWLRKEHGWTKTPPYLINNDTTILDICSNGNNLEVLIRSQDIVLNELNIVNSNIHLKSRVTLVEQYSKLLQGVVTGSLCVLEEGSFLATCLLAEKCQPLIQVHSLTSDQHVGVRSLQPPEGALLLPLVSVQGSTLTLLGISRDKLFIWDISSALLKMVELVSGIKTTSERLKPLVRCTWAKAEKGLLFGVFQEDCSEVLVLMVVNPNTGMFQSLCRYVCLSCKPSLGNRTNRISKSLVQCHQLVSVCKQGHLTVFNLLTAKSLITYNANDPCAAILKDSSLMVGTSNGVIDMFEVTM